MHCLYTILQDILLSMPQPDRLAFTVRQKNFVCCHLVELPIGEYDFSLVRHFLFDHAEAIRYEMLSASSFEPLARLARKIKGELKYHVLHANSWITRSGPRNGSKSCKIQSALNVAMPYAFGMFEETDTEQELITQQIFYGEKQLQQYWEERVREQLEKANLEFPEVKLPDIHFGGRRGHHTEHLHQLLEEMAQVFRMESNIEW